MIVDSFPFIGVLFGAADVGAVTDQASQIRDTMLNESQDDYAKGEKHIRVRVFSVFRGLSC